jgi:hypothetical protein
MKIKTDNKTPRECGRKEDLIAYLYGEDGAAERASFERHLRECDLCRGEIGAFGRVRDDLKAWQVGAVPRTEITISKRRLDLGGELWSLFPAWARGVALSAAALSLLLFALSFAGARLGLDRNGHLEARRPDVTSEEVRILVQEAVANERDSIREQLQAEYRVQLSDLKAQLNADHEAKLEAVKAGLRAELKKSNRVKPSIRSFFAMGEYQEMWGETK